MKDHSKFFYPDLGKEKIGTLLNKSEARKLLVAYFLPVAKKISDLSLIDALRRVLALALDKVHSLGDFAESVIITMIAAIWVRQFG